MASLITSASHSPTCTITGLRPGGGVKIRLMSRTPLIAICMVRGMGVAESVSTSTCSRMVLSCSLCCTPKRCSSSIITSPKLAGFTSDESKRCVPISTSTSPALNPSSARRCSAGEIKRDSTRTHRSKGVKRSKNVSKCCCAKMVVGHSTITCLPSWQHLNAARRATSVLPKPTSPQSSLSIGFACSMSALMSASARS